MDWITVFGNPVQNMTYTEAVALYRVNPRQAVQRWNAEFERRRVAFEAQPETVRYGDMGGNQVNRDFWGWVALVCDICGAGPGKCSGYHPE